MSCGVMNVSSTNFKVELKGHRVVQLSRETLGATETVILALESFGDAVFDVSGSSLLLLDCDAISSL